MTDETSGAPQLPEQFFENIVKSAPGAEIRQPKSYDLPQELDLSGVQETDRPLLELGLSNINKYLSYPAIADEFKDHHERRNWREKKIVQMRSDYGDEAADRLNRSMKRNRVSIGRITTWTSVGPFRQYVPRETMERLDNILSTKVNPKDNPINWDQMSKEEKLAVTEELSHIAADIYRHFGKPAAATAASVG